MKGLRRTITVDPDLLAKINEFRAEQLMKNIELDFTKAINMFAKMGIDAWKLDNKDITLIRHGLFFEYLGQSLAEAALISVMNKEQ